HSILTLGSRLFEPCRRIKTDPLMVHFVFPAISFRLEQRVPAN
ncbi:hypothetical protein CDAR_10311, partial [Caerostris darwini]